MIYFDNAATTFPKPGCVVQAVQQAMLYYGANPGRGGHDLSMQTGRMIHRCRERAAALSARAGGVHQKLHRIAQYRHQGTGAAGGPFHHLRPGAQRGLPCGGAAAAAGDNQIQRGCGGGKRAEDCLEF